MTYPIVENWRSVVERGEGLSNEQARSLLNDLQWAMDLANRANAALGNSGQGRFVRPQYDAHGYEKDPAQL